jgi:hypothetical protein
MLFLVICLILAVILSTCRNEKLISYSVINRAELGKGKVSYNIRVDLVNGRLPTTLELEAISHSYTRGRKSTTALSFRSICQAWWLGLGHLP